jgi:hypothetical protein
MKKPHVAFTIMVDLYSSRSLLRKRFISQVQTQASCTFTSFKAPGLLGGVNDYRSTVGQSSANPELGFIRYSNGSVTYFSPPNAGSTSFTGRNDAE